VPSLERFDKKRSAIHDGSGSQPVTMETQEWVGEMLSHVADRVSACGVVCTHMLRSLHSVRKPTEMPTDIFIRKPPFWSKTAAYVGIIQQGSSMFWCRAHQSFDLCVFIPSYVFFC